MTLLSRFGHCVNNTKLMETALAEKILSDGSPDVPAGVLPGLPAVLCCDNKDLAKETLSGEGTTHCTNRILVQFPQRLPSNDTYRLVIPRASFWQCIVAARLRQLKHCLYLLNQPSLPRT